MFSKPFYFFLPVMPRLLVRATLVAVSLVAASARAQSPALTLEDCIARAMKRNFDLQIQGYTTAQAKEALNVANTDFDPTLTASTRRSVTQAASTTSTLDGTTAVGPRNDNTTANLGVSQRIPQTNATVSLSANTSRAATNSRFSTLNPAFGSGLTATVSQPLLRNAGGEIAKSNIERNKLGVSIALLNYKTRVLTVIRDTENAYYNLVSSRETLRIRQNSLALAQKLLDENKAKRATGTMTDLDVLTAEVGVANARRAVIQAEQTVRNSEDSLQNLINVDDFNVRPGAVSFAEYNEPAPNVAEVYKVARDSSPDYLATQNQIRQTEIDLANNKTNRRPTLNLDGSLGYNSTDRSYGDVFASLPNRHGNNWSVGLTYNMPWGMKADNARYRSTLAGLNSQKTRLQQLEQTLLVNVRTSVRSVETNIAAVEIASKATQLSQKQYELQKARFDAGLSTSRLVLQAQDDLEAARVNELATKVTLRTAVAELHRLQGTSIQRFRVQLPE